MKIRQSATPTTFGLHVLNTKLHNIQIFAYFSKKLHELANSSPEVQQ